MAQPQLQAQPQQPQPQQQQPQVVSGPAGPFASTSLYVGDLEANVSEAQLYEIFSQVGPVISIRVCRDLITRRSLGYAYVNYNSAQDAARALELLNFTAINGKPVRIMFSHRDPSIRKSGHANIFIKNLDKSIDNKQLYDTFQAFGQILSCKIAVDGQGQSKGYGFVQFEQESSAALAIEKVNGMLLKEKEVFVGPFVRRQERETGSSSTKFNNVFVKNLGDQVNDDDLKREFGAFGTISSAVVMKDGDGKSKCFGFVNFENPEDAAKAVEALNGKKDGDKEWYVGRAQKKSEREAELRAKFEADRKERTEKYQGGNLYLKNLDDSYDDEKLRELFGEFGAITSCKVMRDAAGQSRGMGFVAFASPEEATRAVTEMNGKMVGSKPLYVALAQRKEDRRQRLQVQFSQRMTPVGVGPAVPTSMPVYPGAPGIGQQQIFFGQPPPGLMPPQPAAFGYQQQMLAGMRPGGQMPNYFVPVMQQRQQQSGPRVGGRRGQQQQQVLPRGQNRQGNNYRGYPPNARNMHEQNQPTQGAMLPVPLKMVGGMPAANASPAVTTLATALAAAAPEQRHSILGEQLYPLVDQLEHEHAGKVTGMLLEMDQTEVLHLIESPDALKLKVQEAMDVLRMATTTNTVTEQLGGMTMTDGQ